MENFFIFCFFYLYPEDPPTDAAACLLCPPDAFPCGKVGTNSSPSLAKARLSRHTKHPRGVSTSLHRRGIFVASANASFHSERVRRERESSVPACDFLALLPVRTSVVRGGVLVLGGDTRDSLMVALDTRRAVRFLLDSSWVSRFFLHCCRACVL